MLPFLKPKNQQVGVIIKDRKPDETSTESQPSEHEGLLLAAKDLHSAINSNDIKAVASALRAAFEILDAEPHVEGEHIEQSE